MFTFTTLIDGLLGNLATSLWFIPYAANMLHFLRGVRSTNHLSIYFARGVVVDNRYPKLVTIGEGTVLATNCMILAHSFVPKGNTVVSTEEILKPVNIGKGVFIGANSVILPGTAIGDGCYVGAGSVVSGLFEKNTLVVGNPAMPKRKKDE